MSLLAIKPLAVYLCGGLLRISIITSSDVLPQLELVQMWLKTVSRYARTNRLHGFPCIVKMEPKTILTVMTNVMSLQIHTMNCDVNK